MTFEKNWMGLAIVRTDKYNTYKMSILIIMIGGYMVESGSRVSDVDILE